jgi:hypothetical protein
VVNESRREKRDSAWIKVEGSVTADEICSKFMGNDEYGKEWTTMQGVA